MDQSPNLPAPRKAKSEDTGGRGLALLEAMSGSWGTEVFDGGKLIWFELPRLDVPAKT